jgi:predicted RNase H-like HicB family nuclease
VVVARCLEVEIASQGETQDQALINLKETLDLYFEDTPLRQGTELQLSASVLRVRAKREERSH